jgi:hypothetical protein
MSPGFIYREPDLALAQPFPFPFPSAVGMVAAGPILDGKVLSIPIAQRWARVEVIGGMRGFPASWAAGRVVNDASFDFSHIFSGHWSGATDFDIRIVGAIGMVEEVAGCSDALFTGRQTAVHRDAENDEAQQKGPLHAAVAGCSGGLAGCLTY